MVEGNDSSSNEEPIADNEANQEGQLESKVDLNNIISHLLLSIVERLTKMCVVCEGPSVSDSSSVKSLVKNMYKFEKSLKKLQKVASYGMKQSDDFATVVKGAVRAVDKYENPYDWAYINVVEKYRMSGKKLDHGLNAVHTLQKELIECLRKSKLEETETNKDISTEMPG